MRLFTTEAMARNHRSKLTVFGPWVALIMMVVTGGCGGDGLNMAEVSGSVTLDGAPLPGAWVEFTPITKGINGRPSNGATDQQGHFVLKYTKTRSGALVGKHDVVISTALMATSFDDMKEVVPSKYNSESTLTFVVEPGHNEASFELKSGKN